MYPFYYIEYGIAQLGAIQVWRNSLEDPAQAVERYRQALSLGAVRSLPDIYRTAGARLTFDADTIGELVQLLETHIEQPRWEPGRGCSLPLYRQDSPRLFPVARRPGFPVMELLDGQRRRHRDGRGC